MRNNKRTRTKPFGVRLDAVEWFILRRLMENQGMLAADIFRDSLIMYAQAKGIETDRAAIIKILQSEQQEDESDK